MGEEKGKGREQKGKGKGTGTEKETGTGTGTEDEDGDEKERGQEKEKAEGKGEGGGNSAKNIVETAMAPMDVDGSVGPDGAFSVFSFPLLMATILSAKLTCDLQWRMSRSVQTQHPRHPIN